MRALLLSGPLFLLAAACRQEPIAVVPTNNPNVDVELLFEHDGCRVYRFWDAGTHYFARCDGTPTTATTITAGKVDESIDTRMR